MADIDPIQNDPNNPQPPSDDKQPGENLLKALHSERQARRNLEKELKQIQDKFNDVDPDKYSQLLEEEKQRSLQKAEDEKKLEQVVKAKNEEITSLSQKLQSSSLAYQELKKQNALQKAYFRNKGKDVNDSLTGGSYFDKFYRDFGDRFKLNDDGSLSILNEKGQDAYNTETGKDVTVDEYFATIKENEFYGRMFEADRIPSGTGHTVGGNGKGSKRQSFEEKFGVKN